jgi:hypothetical protein
MGLGYPLKRFERFGTDGRGRSMQRFDNLNRRPTSSLVANSSADGKVASFNGTGQRSLDDIGGEPLAGSGFENEEPDSEFAAAGGES